MTQGWLSPTVDSDADGLPDSWETLYFGGTSSIEGGPFADPDGDAINNLEEYLSGTNPTNRNSVLACNVLAPQQGSGFSFTWSSASGAVYRIESRDSLASDTDWTGLASGLPATPPLNTYTDSNPAKFRNYRVLLAAPP
jgi:hypothetical protein